MGRELRKDIGRERRETKVLGKKARIKAERKRRVVGREMVDGMRGVEQTKSKRVSKVDVMSEPGFAELRIRRERLRLSSSFRFPHPLGCSLVDIDESAKRRSLRCTDDPKRGAAICCRLRI